MIEQIIQQQELLKQLVAKLTILVTTLSSLLGTPQGLLQLQHKQTPNGFLGAASGSGGFPTSTLNNFQDGDVINAGDWNALERKIGKDKSSDTTSLDWMLRAGTSTDPGHLHTTSSITDITYIKPISEGGSGTSTYTYGFIIGSSTSPFTTLGPTANGQIPIASGTTWVTNTLSAGTGVSITNSAGGISISGSSPNLIAVSTSTVDTRSTTATATLMLAVIPANTLGTSTEIQARIYLDTIGTQGGVVSPPRIKINASYGGVEFATSSLQLACDNGSKVCFGYLDISILANNSTSSQISSMFALYDGSDSPATSSLRTYGVTNTSVNSTIANNLLVTTTNSASAATQGLIMRKYIVKKNSY